jgi:hypothetical protein
MLSTTLVSMLVLFAAVPKTLAQYTLASTIPWTPTAPSSVDQSAIFNHTYYLADRTLKGIHVISLSNKTQTALIQGFTTTLSNTSTIVSSNSGPDGLIVLADRNELWAGDGMGVIRVVSLLTNTIVANISTGSKSRADEFAYSPSGGSSGGPAGGIVVVTNPNETPDPYVSVINATSRALMGKIVFTGAGGLEQPRWDPTTGLFFVSVPDMPGAESGGVVTLDVVNMKIGQVIPTPRCENAGIVFGAGASASTLFVSCSAAQSTKFPGLAMSYLYSITSGPGSGSNSLQAKLIANVTNVNGVDQVAFSNKTGWFYASAYQYVDASGTPAPFLAVIDAATGKVLQRIATDNVTAHAVAVDQSTGDMVVPVKGKGVLVYSLGNGTGTGTGTSAGGAGASGSGTASGGAATASTSGAGRGLRLGLSWGVVVVVGLAFAVGL